MRTRRLADGQDERDNVGGYATWRPVGLLKQNRVRPHTTIKLRQRQ